MQLKVCYNISYVQLNDIFMSTIHTENAFVVIEIIEMEKKITPFFCSHNASTYYHQAVEKIKELAQSSIKPNLAVYFVPLVVSNNIGMLEFIRSIENNIDFHIKKPLISYIQK